MCRSRRVEAQRACARNPVSGRGRGPTSVTAQSRYADLGDEAMGEITSLLQGVHLPCWILDEQGILVWVNEAFVETFGDRRGDRYSVLIAPESLEAAERHFELSQAHPADEVELSLLLRDGRHVRTEISSVLLESVGLCCGAFGISGKAARPQPAAGSALTPRQLDVLVLLSGGASTEQIASELYISKTTARNHISHILQALGVHSRLAAVAKARREGLVGD